MRHTAQIWSVSYHRYPGAEVPKYLAEADLPGTYGFDPLRLGTNPDNLKWCALAAGDAQPACRQCCVQRHSVSLKFIWP